MTSRKSMTLYPEYPHKEIKNVDILTKIICIIKNKFSKLTLTYEDTEIKTYRGLAQGSVLSPFYSTYTLIDSI